MELNRLGYLLDYLSLEDDVRPVTLKFHTYPVEGAGNGIQEMVETDEDILNLFKPRDRISSQQEFFEKMDDEDRSSNRSGQSRERNSKDPSMSNLLKGV